MKFNRRFSFFLIIACFVFIFDGCSFSSAEALKAKPAKAAPDARAQMADALKSGKPVFLYFFAGSVKKSRDDLKKVEAVAAKNKALVVKVDADVNEALRADFSVEYAPSLFVLRPGMGITDSFVVDIAEKQIARSLAKNYTPPNGVKSIKAGSNGSKPTLVFFMADWCGYCQKIIPEVDAYRRDYGKQVNIVQVDLDADPNTADLYLVSGVPVLVALDKNGAVHRRMSYQPNAYKAFEDTFRQLGVDGKKKPKGNT